MAKLDKLVERTLMASRWLLLPLYLGLALFLVLMVVAFFREIVHVAVGLSDVDATGIILLALRLIDLSLVASLVVMVMLSSYENFVSKLDIATSEAHLAWLGKLDTGSLKIKLASAIVAISAIHLLSVFMEAVDVPNDKLLWLVVMHLAFVATAVLLALLERITVRAGQ